jgi:hypothetical protein
MFERFIVDFLHLTSRFWLSVLEYEAKFQMFVVSASEYL